MSVFSKGRVCRGSKSPDLFVLWIDSAGSLGPWIQISTQVVGENVDEFRETRLQGKKEGEHVSPNSPPNSTFNNDGAMQSDRETWVHFNVLVKLQCSRS